MPPDSLPDETHVSAADEATGKSQPVSNPEVPGPTSSTMPGVRRPYHNLRASPLPDNLHAIGRDCLPPSNDLREPALADELLQYGLLQGTIHELQQIPSSIREIQQPGITQACINQLRRLVHPFCRCPQGQCWIHPGLTTCSFREPQ